MEICDKSVSYRLQKEALLQNNDVSAMEILLIMFGSNSDVQDETTNLTLLMKAAFEGLVDMVDLLIKYGASVDFVNLLGYTALMCACQGGQLETCKILVKLTKHVNLMSIHGLTGLMLAAIEGHHEIICLLSNFGADLNIKTTEGHTSLMMACFSSHPKCVETLVTRGAEICWRTSNGRSARDKAPSNAAVLLWLDPQIQVGLTEKHQYRLRHNVLSNLRKHSERNTLSLNFGLKSQPAGYRLRFPFRPDENSQWQWSSVLRKTLDLPFGLFETVLGYLPMPRVWKWNLDRIERRIAADPDQAARDMSVVVDEILCDANILSGGDQRHFMLKIARFPQLQEYLRLERRMPNILVQSLCWWADENNIFMCDATARLMLMITRDLFQWYTQNECHTNSLGPSPHSIHSLVVYETKSTVEVNVELGKEQFVV